MYCSPYFRIHQKMQSKSVTQTQEFGRILFTELWKKAAVGWIAFTDDVRPTEGTSRATVGVRQRSPL